MGQQFTPPPLSSSSLLSDGFAEALDRSAEDLREGRTERATEFLSRMRARVDAYFAGNWASSADAKDRPARR